MNDKIIENRHRIVVESAALKVDVAIRRKSKSKLTLLEVLTEF